MKKNLSEENRIKLIKMYRNNPAAAARDLLGVDLAPHQRVILKSMWDCNNVIIILSRGTGKTWTDAVFAVLRAMLFPGEKVGIFSSSYRQAKFVFDEICKLYDISPILRDCCEKKPTKMVDMCYLQFKSTGNRPGSVIHALPLGDGGTIRGARYFTIIADETAQIPREILDVVVRGMMATSKNPMEQVKALEEQKRLLQEGKIDKIKKLHNNKIVMSSTAYYQYNHLWERVKGYIEIIMEKAEKAKNIVKAGGVVPDDLTVELRGGDLNGQIPYNIMKDENRALIAFNCDNMPEGFMNTESIEEAKREMPRYQFLMEYFCFLKDSEILTNVGVKKIQDVKIGDMVFTHMGRFRRVTNLLSRKYSGKIVRYSSFGTNNVVGVTVNHEFLSNKSWKQICDFKNGDYLHQRFLSELSGIDNVDITDFINCEYLFSEVGGKEYVYPLTGKSKKKSGERGSDKLFKTSIPRRISIDRNLGLVFGWYASEGSGGANGKQISFSVDSHVGVNYQDYIEELSVAIKKSFGLSPKFFDTKNGTINMLVNSDIVYGFIKSICPGVSDTKIMNPEILFSNREFLEGFITGYWHGDGCINSKPQAVAGCVNYDLLSQIKLAISYFGIPSSLMKGRLSGESEICGRKIKTKDVFYLRMNGKHCKMLNNLINKESEEIKKSKYSNQYISSDEENGLFKIREMRIEDYSGDVYNLSVEEDESYSLINSNVHNCYFPPDSEGFFPMSILDKARRHGDFACEFSFNKQEDKDCITVMGCDPARSGDNFAIAIFKVNLKTEKIRLIRVLTYNKMTYPFMHLEIRRLRKLYNISEIAIDSGGGGSTIRDLLADNKICPPGDDVILQRDFDEHRFKNGKKILSLKEFSDYEWLSGANNNLLLGLQNGTLQLPSEKGSLKNASDFDESPDEESARREIDKTLEEMQNIIVTRTQSGRAHWGTPQKRQRKDRYSAVLIGYSQAYSYLENLNKPQSLAGGFWF